MNCNNWDESLIFGQAMTSRYCGLYSTYLTHDIPVLVGSTALFWAVRSPQMGLSIKGGIPKMMVYHGKSQRKMAGGSPHPTKRKPPFLWRLGVLPTASSKAVARLTPQRCSLESPRERCALGLEGIRHFTSPEMAEETGNMEEPQKMTENDKSSALVVGTVLW